MYRLLYPLLILSISVSCSQRTKDKKATAPLKELIAVSNRSASRAKYLNTSQWNELFPNRYGKGLKDSINNNPDFYSFQSFVTACKAFPDFLSTGDEEIQKRELAAFLANIAQETSGGWSNAPGGYFKWGLYFLEEQGKHDRYIDTTNKNYPPVMNKSYYGRGPKQLTWNYNYGQFSEAWFGTKDSLLKEPERLSHDPVLSFASAIWFWMTTQPPKPSCHDIITAKWKPSEDDIINNRLPGFGATVNVINGGVECGNQAELEKTSHRYEYYKYFCNYFHVQPGENVSCLNQKPFGTGRIQ